MEKLLKEMKLLASKVCSGGAQTYLQCLLKLSHISGILFTSQLHGLRNSLFWGYHRPVPNSVYGLEVYFKLWKLMSKV